MYYYKTSYTDGTWAYVKSRTPLSPSDVCGTCIAIQRRSALWYWGLRLRYGKC